MARFSRKIYKAVLVGLFILAGTNACKDDYTSIVPYMYVNFDFNPTNYIEFKVPGGAVYFPNPGYGGIIVINNWGDEYTPYLAFDATCTHEVSSTVRVAVTENGSGIAVCPECGSKFLLFGSNGNPIMGPAAEPLRQYHANLVGGRIYISN
ncbi:MAG: hypothetical protein WC384_06055 [Prolixibacteraceae bacterium]|jgi:nitrite reductase/ring-hydroxylating ferredoxin subunit